MVRLKDKEPILTRGSGPTTEVRGACKGHSGVLQKDHFCKKMVSQQHQKTAQVCQ